MTLLNGSKTDFQLGWHSSSRDFDFIWVRNFRKIKNLENPKKIQVKNELAFLWIKKICETFNQTFYDQKDRAIFDHPNLTLK